MAMFPFGNFAFSYLVYQEFKKRLNDSSSRLLVVKGSRLLWGPAGQGFWVGGGGGGTQA